MSQASARSRPVRIGVLFVLALSGVVAAFATIREAQDAHLLLPKAAVLEPVNIPFADSVLPSPETFLREERFQRGDTVSGLLGRLGVADEDLKPLLRVRALRLLRPGLTVNAEVGADGRVLALDFLSSASALVSIRRGPDGFVASEESAPLSVRTEMKAGTIRSSLFAAADAIGMPDNVAIQIAEIFGGDIDFHRDLRRGDRFAVVYEMSYLNGRPVRSGRVLAAEFVNQGKSLRAVYFPGSDRQGGYYAPDGKNLRKAFLRSPLEFSRISSGFGMRMHPFLQTWRAHRGIDYAAPSGTRVRAVGDGVVEFAGKNGGYGNVVVLRHHGAYSTVYAHLSMFAAGVRKGARVTQGDSIGHVGQTGWATGPHLHYEFRVSGEARNPLAIAMPAAQPVSGHEMAAYRQQAAPLVARLNLLASTDLALLE